MGNIIQRKKAHRKDYTVLADEIEILRDKKQEILV